MGSRNRILFPNVTAPGAFAMMATRYFDRYGLPELPPKPRSYEDTVAMCMKSYEDVLWDHSAKVCSSRWPLYR